MQTPFPAAPPFAQRLALILDELCRAVAARAGLRPAMAPQMLLLWSYLRRAGRRLAALATRPGLPPAPPRASGPVRARTIGRPARLPRGFAWLVRAVPGSGNFGGQLQHLLADPDMAALLAMPAAGRILRPLCHMLGLRPGPDLPAALFPPQTLRPAAPRPGDTAAPPVSAAPPIPATAAVGWPNAPPATA